MPTRPAFHGVELLFNPLRERGPDYPDACHRVVSRERFSEAHQRISAWPGYQSTPLVELTGLARSCSIDSVCYKDESSRFGLGSFKALGGAYAVSRVLESELKKRGSQPQPKVDEPLITRPESVREITVTCATDGNHGRSVAWGAQLFGCACVIYIHATVSNSRRQAIESYGARVVRTSGNYDECVRQAQADARRNGWFVVSDTSYDGYMDVPRDVMQGYTVMVQEALDGMTSPPTHVFVQAGVGGLAAAVAGHLWETLGDRRPQIIVCEPDRAACCYESARAGEPVAVTGELDTIMAGLACGEVSRLAWTVLSRAASAFMIVPDELARGCMKLLAAGIGGDPPLVAGESAVAGFAGLLAVAASSRWREALELTSGSRVLLIGTEGDTDPEVYRQIVGWSASEVRQGVSR